MTVKELIEELQRMPQDARVLLEDGDDVVGDLTEVIATDRLEGFPCAGFSKSIKDLPRALLIGAVIIG